MHRRGQLKGERRAALRLRRAALRRSTERTESNPCPARISSDQACKEMIGKVLRTLSVHLVTHLLAMLDELKEGAQDLAAALR